MLFSDGVRPKGPGDRGTISNGEFLAICMLSLGPTTMRDLKTLLGRWRSLDGEYGGNEAYFRSSRNGVGAWGPRKTKWCGRLGDEKCYWWSMRKEMKEEGKATKSVPYLVLSEQGLRLALGGLQKIRKIVGSGDR